MMAGLLAVHKVTSDEVQPLQDYEAVLENIINELHPALNETAIIVLDDADDASDVAVVD